MTDQDFELKMKRMIANLQFAQGDCANEKGSFKNKKTSESENWYECGNLGHYVNRCPNKNPKSYKSRTPSNAPNNRQHAEWTNHAPNAGEPTSSKDKGVTYHWCAKCNRWTLSHNPENHVRKAPPGSARTGSRSNYKGRNNSNSDTAIAANMVFDPWLQWQSPLVQNESKEESLLKTTNLLRQHPKPILQLSKMRSRELLIASLPL